MFQELDKRSWMNMEWKKVEYSKKKIKKAGYAISKNDYSAISQDEAYTMVNNWRAAHAFPLQIFYINCKRQAQKYKNAIAVQRIKRLDSIVGKLQRSPQMDIVRMQDLGGCRIIVDNIADVYSIIDDFKSSRIRHKLIREYDYIKNPKESGYRSVHLVYSYFSDKKPDYNNLLIEIQIRTQLQHLWATAIEVLGFYTKYNLKASQGDERILRYMELVSALFCFEEKMPLSNNVPNNKEEIVSEIESLSDLRVLSMLKAVNRVLRYTDEKEVKNSLNKDHYFLLMNYYERNTLKLTRFKKTDIGVATTLYEDLERGTDNVDTVLVSATSIDVLKKAYPNYFADVRAFVSKVEKILKKYKNER